MNSFRRFFPVVLSLLLVAAAPAQDKVKIATVNMEEVFKNYYRTKELQQQVDVDRGLIKQENEKRLEVIKELEAQLEILGKQLEDTTIAIAKKRKIKEERDAKFQEGTALNTERKEFVARRQRALNEKFMESMKSILEEIRELVDEKAKVADYDFVIDKSALSAQQVPVLLYSKDGVDITAEILKELNKNAPAEDPKDN